MTVGRHGAERKILTARKQECSFTKLVWAVLVWKLKSADFNYQLYSEVPWSLPLAFKMFLYVEIYMGLGELDRLFPPCPLVMKSYSIAICGANQKGQLIGLPVDQGRWLGYSDFGSWNLERPEFGKGRKLSRHMMA